ncbi:cytochrome P450 [Wenxinia marina]|uniref:Cytochrome P450 n=1 Tax=Wenxinia marina DSM 24838 TaxID=1123501 RepID=A0A0D0NNK1_9RHOB|nr:cytochrome P450 [Wenxinia marina]KIQ69830.1 Cytochrome P450 [Wenxinia marina DSM 24838]GGL61581.1 cytochrome P450 [Wenxinia marina]
MAADDGLRPLSPTPDWNPHGEAELADPIGTHARLRAECPVAGSTEWGGFFTLTRYEDVVAASKDPATFTATRQSVIPASPKIGLPRLPLQRDPPESHRYRQALNRFFRESRIAGMESPLRDKAEALRAELEAEAEPEFGTAFSAPFSVRALCLVIGMDVAEADEIGRLSHDYVAAVQSRDLKTAGGISRTIDGFARDLVADRMAAPRDPEVDMVSGFMAHDTRGEPFDETELAGMVRLLLIGGHVVPRNLMTSMAWHLCGDRDLQDRLRTDRVDRTLLVEEFLRFYSPNQALVRATTQDTKIGGRAIPKGCPVALNFLSANRDETVFDAPMEFREDRHPNRHIAFGVGVHACAGQPLARLEARIALDTLAAMPPFAAAGDPLWARWTEYGVSRLSLRWV